MARKYSSYGLELWIGDDGSPEQMFKVASVGDTSGPQNKADTIDSSTHDDPDPYHDFITTLLDGGDITLALWLDPSEASHNETPTSVGVSAGGLKYLFDQRVQRNMELRYAFTSPHSKSAFRGGVTAFSMDAKVTGGFMASVTIKTKGKNTLELYT